MYSTWWNLTKVTFLSKKNELPHAIKSPLDRQARANRAGLADEIEELPNGNSTHSARNRFDARQFPDQPGAVQEISRQKLPS